MKKMVALLLALMMVVACMPALAEQPEGYPEVVEGIDFGGQTIYIYDYWTADDSRKDDPSEEEQAQYDYRDWIMETYNCEIRQIQKGDWTTNVQELTNFCTSPDGTLCLYILPPDFVGTPMGNDLFAAWESENIDFEDDKSGKMVFNTGMAEISPEAGKITINLRYPVSCDVDDIFSAMEPLLTRYNMGRIVNKHRLPIYLDLENPMVKLLMDIYRNQTGDETSEPLVIGGGTYARATPNIIAYGAAFPGDEDLMHQKNECMSVERFRQMTKIYTEAIYKLASGDYNI